MKKDEIDQECHDAGSQEILSNLDVSEQVLAKRLKAIEVRGKSTRGLRKVFVLLTDLMHRGCNHLNLTRMLVGVPPSQQYLFARISGDHPLDGCEAMRVMTDLCERLKKLELI